MYNTATTCSPCRPAGAPVRDTGRDRQLVQSMRAEASAFIQAMFEVAP
jgi:hypothetical protein